MKRAAKKDMTSNLGVLAMGRRGRKDKHCGLLDERNRCFVLVLVEGARQALIRNYNLSRRFGLLVAVIFCISVISQSALRAQEVEKSVKLSQEEATILQQLLSTDEFLKELSNAQAGLAALNRLARTVTPGPTKLVLRWNEALFKTWGTANTHLMAIGKSRACDALLVPVIENSQNAQFFEDLRQLRGCD